VGTQSTSEPGPLPEPDVSDAVPLERLVFDPKTMAEPAPKEPSALTPGATLGPRPPPMRMLFGLPSSRPDAFSGIRHPSPAVREHAPEPAVVTADDDGVNMLEQDDSDAADGEAACKDKETWAQERMAQTTRRNLPNATSASVAPGPLRYIPPAPASAGDKTARAEAASVEVKTDRTKCLIRALRSRADSAPLVSAAVPGTVNPTVLKMQKEQQAKHLENITKNTAAQASRGVRRPLSSLTGTLAPSVPTAASAPGPSSAGPGTKRARVQSWSAMPRERRQACVRVSLAAAVTRAPSAALATLHHVWQEDPRRPQRVTHDIRKELAESSVNWTERELKLYLREADLSGSGGRADLARRVHTHLRPPDSSLATLMAGSRRDRDRGRERERTVDTAVPRATAREGREVTLQKPPPF
jgi:hypothetical protein